MALFACLALAGPMTAGAAAAPGDPDTTFNATGKQTLDLGSAPIGSEANGVAVDSSGRTVIVGTSGGDIALARYTTGGALDTAFGGGDGTVLTDIEPAFGSFDQGNAVAIDSLGRIVVAGSSDSDFVIARYTSAGVPDTDFNGSGTEPIDLGGADEATGVAIGSGDSIVTAGTTDAMGDDDFAAVRLDSAGALDPTFNGDGDTDGVVILRDAGTPDRAHAMKLITAGKIVIVGNTVPALQSDADFDIWQLTSTGAPDLTFNLSGQATLDIGGNVDQAKAVTTDGSGNVVVAGQSDSGSSDFAVARYSSLGVLDVVGFGGGNGYVTADLGGSDVANGVAVDGSDRIVVGGTSTGGASGGNDFAVARLTSSGALDTSNFGSPNGYVVTDFGTSGPTVSDDAGNALVLNGTAIAVAGSAEEFQLPIDDFAVMQFTSSGGLDGTFGTGGKVRTPFSVDSTDTPRGVAIDSSDRTLIAGTTDVGTGTPGLFLARYNANGALDSTFSGDGQTGEYEQTLPESVDSVADVVIDGSQILVAVNTDLGKFGVVALSSSGVVDQSFGNTGIATADFQAGTGSNTANGIAVDGSGRIVEAGFTAASGGQPDFAVARFTSAGSLDSSFSGDGLQTTDFGADSDDEATGVAVDGSNNVVLGGTRYSVGTADFAVARYEAATGNLDTSFDGDGQRTDDLGSSSFDHANGVAVDGTNRVVLAGASDNGGDDDFALARYTAGGGLDSTFSSDGKAFTDIEGSSGFDTANALTIDGSGNILAAGKSNGGGDQDFALVRYTTGGSADSGFGGSDGTVTTSFGDSDVANDVAVGPNGKIALAGSTGSISNATEDAALARYLGGSGGGPTQHTLLVNKASVAGGSGTVTSGPAGITCGGTCSALFNNGASVTLTATSSNSLAATWAGCNSVNASNQCVVTMTADKIVTATFKRPTLSAVKSGTGSGTVTSNPSGITCDDSGTPDCAEAYDNGTPVVLTATPGANAIFNGWQGCAGGTGNQCNVTVDADKTATATFTSTVPQYALTVSKTGSGASAGTVTSNPGGVNCGATCQHSFDEDTAVTLTANPGANNSFTAWSGEGCAGTGTCQVTMSQVRNVSANFVLDQHALTVNRTGSGTGGVTSSPSGINCAGGAPDCSESYDHGTAVTLSASPDAGSRFSGWSGGGCSGTATCQVTVNAATTVSANFALQRQLTTGKTGNGTGTVTSSPAGITCGAACQASFDDGQLVTLTAAADASSTFSGWTGCDSVNGSNQCLVTMNGTESVSAGFALVQRQLTVNVSGSGSVSSSPAGISNCTTTNCQASYDHGTSVTLTATPGAGQIADWTGCDSEPTANQCTVAMTAARTVAADLRRPILSVALAGTGTGTVASTPAGISCQPTCVVSFDSGTQVTLDATPTGGSTFAGWTGACTGTGACVVTVNQDAGVFATFVAPPAPGGGGPIAAPPNTSLSSAKVKAGARKATFKFTGAGGSGALNFECKLDRKAFSSCTSPKKYKGLKPGKHTFQVRAKDGRGQSDGSPATKKFKIPKPR